MSTFDQAQHNSTTQTGERIKLFRKRAGLSQLDLEIELDMSPGSVCRIEKSKVIPLNKTIFKIAKHLKLTDEEFMFLIGWKRAIGHTLDQKL